MTRKALALASLSLGSLTMIGFAAVDQSSTLDGCANGLCTMRMTAPELLRATEKLVFARRFDEARPLIEALRQAPEMSMEANFLHGYVATETGDLKGGEKAFRAVLRDRPELTRARLELARVLMLEGKDSAADHHYRLAEEAQDLPPEIERTIRLQRGVIRDRRNWHLNLDVGLAPDTNINNATDSRSISIFGQDGYVLSRDARRESGIGQTANISSGVRLRLSDGLAMVLDADGQIVNQPGKAADDISALIAAGPELTMKGGARVSIQATGVQRWYGGKVAQQGGGIRLNYQRNLDAGARIGVQADIRHITSGYSNEYDGWQYAGYATYERVVHRTMVASATAFLRREDLHARPYSSTEAGYSVGIGGELPRGINAGVSVGISRAWYDAPLLLFSEQTRRDWRVNARAYVGLRSVRVLGFSPSLTYTYNRTQTPIDFYRTDRHRLVFGLARYF